MVREWKEVAIEDANGHQVMRVYRVFKVYCGLAEPVEFTQSDLDLLKEARIAVEKP